MSHPPPNSSRGEGSFAPAPADLLTDVYNELRRIAGAKMSREAPGLTLQPTALVHEAWLRLGGDAQPRWANRAHFFAAAAEAMRRILIDRARRRAAARHGGGQCRISLEDLETGADVENDAHLLAVHEALETFSRREPRKAELVKLRYFVGLNHEEIAQTLGISVPTAKRWWAYARAWLLAELRTK